MFSDTAVLLALIALGAAWLLVHVALLIRTARAPGLPVALRALAWLPPLSPIVSWRAGARVLALVWVAHAVAYLVLRSMA